MKKTLSFLLIAGMVLASFAGCSGGQSEAPAESQTPASSEAAPSSGAPAPGEQTVIEYIDHFNEETKVNGVTAVIEKFEAKYPQYKVEAAHTSSDTFLDQIRTRVAAGDPYDVFMGILTDFSELVDKGEILPLEDQPFTSRINEATLEPETKDGHIWAIPTSTSIGGVYYNKKVFEEQGIKAPTTRSEFKAACEKLQAAGIIPISGGYMQGNVVLDNVQWVCHPLWQTMGENDINRKIMDGEAKFADSKAYLEGLKVWNEIELDFMDANELSVDRSERVIQLANGTLGMLASGSWSVGDIRTAAPDGEFGFIPVCVFEEVEKNGVILANDDGFMISAKAKNLEGALAYMDFLTSEEGAKAWLEKSKTISSIKGLTMDDADPMVQEMLALVDKGQRYYAKDAVQFEGPALTKARTVFRSYVALPPEQRKDYENALKWLDDEFDAMR